MPTEPTTAHPDTEALERAGACNRIYQAALARGDVRLALAAERERCRVLGLYPAPAPTESRSE